MSDLELSQRVIDCLSGSPSSAIITEVIEAVRHERERLTEERRSTEAAAVDPLSNDVDFEASSLRLRELDLLLSRNEAQSSRLAKALEEADHREDQAERVKAYEKAKEFVALAADMKAAADLQMSSALDQCRDAEAWALSANNALPEGYKPIVIHELVAAERVIERTEVQRWYVDGKFFEQDPRKMYPGDIRFRNAKFDTFIREVFLRRGKTETEVRFERSFSDEPLSGLAKFMAEDYPALLAKQIVNAHRPQP